MACGGGYQRKAESKWFTVSAVQDRQSHAGYEAVYEMVHDAVSEGVITPPISVGFYLQCEIREVLEWAK